MIASDLLESYSDIWMRAAIPGQGFYVLDRMPNNCYPRNLVAMVVDNEDGISPHVHVNSKGVSHDAIGHLPSFVAAR
jgi:hypothetical protein